MRGIALALAELEKATTLEKDPNWDDSSNDVKRQLAAYHVARAQVYATLALTVAEDSRRRTR